MGSVCHHRLPALGAACVSSLAFVLLVVSGTTRNFIEVIAQPGDFLATPNGFLPNTFSHGMGVLRDSDIYDREGDTMWIMSRIFFIISLSLGSITAMLSWAVTTFISPNTSNWKSLSILSSLTAVIQVPIFLLFEANPCLSYGGQSCKASSGVFLLVASTILWVVVTLVTQCLDPPLWATELNQWRVEKQREMPHAQESDGFHDITSDDDEYLLLQQYSSQNRKQYQFFGGISRWVQKRRWASDVDDLPLIGTEMSHDKEEWRASNKYCEGKNYPGTGSYYANSDNSRLLLKVMPNGKRPGNDEKSIMTFGDLDDMVEYAEGGLLSAAPSMDLCEESAKDDDQNLLGEGFLKGEDKKGLEKLNQSQKILLNIASKEKILIPSSMDEKVPWLVDEPQFYTDPRAFSTIRAKGTSLTSNTETETSVGSQKRLLSPEEPLVEHSMPARKIALGIRALTIRIKRDTTNRKLKNGKAYAMMDDDDSASSLSSDGESEDDEEGNVSELSSPSRGGNKSDSSSNGRLMTNWNALFCTKQLLSPDDSGSYSSKEDDPQPVYYSSENEAHVSMSISSLGHATEDDSSTISGSSMSDSSDNDLQRRLSRGKRRKRKARQRQLSCGKSVSSRTSVLTMTIDEETDIDLKAQESSDDERSRKTFTSPIKTPQSILEGSHRPISGLLRTKSAPNLLYDVDSGMPTTPDLDSRSLSGKALRESSDWVRTPMTEMSSDAEEPADKNDPTGFVTTDVYDVDSGMPTTPDLDSPSLSGKALREPSDWVRTPMPEMSSDAEEPADKNDPTGFVTTDEKDPAEQSDQTGTVITDDEDQSPVRRGRSPSRSACKKSSHHPYLEESIFRNGIHSTLIAVVSDDVSTNSDASNAEASTHSNISHRVRQARMRRLQNQNEDVKRRRARTTEPPRKRHMIPISRSQSPSGRSYDAMKKFIRIESTDDVEYGPEEASL